VRCEDTPAAFDVHFSDVWADAQRSRTTFIRLIVWGGRLRLGYSKQVDDVTAAEIPIEKTVAQAFCETAHVPRSAQFPSITRFRKFIGYRYPQSNCAFLRHWLAGFFGIGPGSCEFADESSAAGRHKLDIGASFVRLHDPFASVRATTMAQQYRSRTRLLDAPGPVRRISTIFADTPIFRVHILGKTTTKPSL
jgi:hypothetical protein